MQRLASLVLFGCALGALAGCSSRTNVGVTGNGPAEATNLWITVQAVRFASAADTPVEAETGWTRETLAAPIVIDLANVEPGTLVPLLSNRSLPAGRYRQLQLEIADPFDRLLDAARAVGLRYNAQVDFVDDEGRRRSAALELPAPGAGLTLPVDFSLAADSESGGDEAAATSLAVAIDAARGLLDYELGSTSGHYLSPEVAVLDAAKAGEIHGRLGTAALAANHPPITVSAQQLDESGSHYRVVRRARVASDGSFSLYPLPVDDGDSTRYTVVISGAGNDTVIVREVPVEAGATATTLQATPIELSRAGTVHADASGAADAVPGGTRVAFYQSLPGREATPYLITGTTLEPMARRFAGEAIALADGVLVAGDYADGGAIAFAARTPVEGSGAFRIGSSGPYRTDAVSGTVTAVRGTRERPTPVEVPYPEVLPQGRAGQLLLNLQVPAGRFDSGLLTLQSGAELADGFDVGALLDRGGGSLAIDGLPAGSALATPGGVVYRVALRAWHSRDPQGTIVRVAGPSSVTLGDAGVAVLTLQVAP